MELKNVRTRDDFIAYLKARKDITKKDLTDGSYGDAVDWFVAVVNAKMVFDSYSTKDLAWIFLKGVTPIDNHPEEVADFLASYFEEADLAKEDGDEEYSQQCINEAVENLGSLINSHFGKR